jgi:hypothetical protein
MESDKTSFEKVVSYQIYHILWISRDFRNFISGVLLSLVSLCPAVFLGVFPPRMEFFEHAPI